MDTWHCGEADGSCHYEGHTRRREAGRAAAEPRVGIDKHLCSAGTRQGHHEQARVLEERSGQETAEHALFLFLIFFFWHLCVCVCLERQGARQYQGRRLSVFRERSGDGESALAPKENAVDKGSGSAGAAII